MTGCTKQNKITAKASKEPLATPALDELTRFFYCILGNALTRVGPGRNVWSIRIYQR